MFPQLPVKELYWMHLQKKKKKISKTEKMVYFNHHVRKADLEIQYCNSSWGGWIVTGELCQLLKQYNTF